MLVPLLTALTAVMPSPAAARTHAEEVVAAERAFAAAAHERGVAAAFLETMDPDRAVRLTPQPKPALAYWSAQAKRTGAPYLEWRPTWAGASRCGDLGFTAGPWSYGDKAFGWYFTVWGRRTADSPYKWLLDAGVSRPTAPHVPDDMPVSYASSSTSPVLEHHRDTYWTEIDATDDALDRDLAKDPEAAYGDRLAEDARTVSVGQADPAVGKEAVLDAFIERPRFSARRLGSWVSMCGDLGVTYGHADWAAQGKPVAGNYVRVWRRADRRWMLLFEELVTPN